MGTAEIIAVVAAGGGLGYLIWKAMQPKPVEDDECAKLCALVPDYEGAQTACIDACKIGKLLGPVVSALSPFYDSSEEWSHEIARRTNINNAANGGQAPTGADVSGAAGVTVKAPAGTLPVPNVPTPTWAKDSGWLNSVLGNNTNGEDLSAGGSTQNGNVLMVGPVFKYPNGCEPYFDAPGFSKCGAGTLDMYASAVDRDSAGRKGITEDQLRYYPPKFTVAEFLGSIGVDKKPPKIDKNQLGTGAVGDPLTTGPVAVGGIGADKADLLWYVRGIKVTAPSGSTLVPRAVVMQNSNTAGNSAATVNANIAALTDAQATELVDPFSSGSGVTTKIDCNSVQAKDSTFTWDPTSGGFWRRMKAGETRNLGPCGPGGSATPISNKVGLVTGAQIFGTSIGT